MLSLFYAKGVLNININKPCYRFHKELTQETEIIDNIILAKIDREAKKLMVVDSCYNEVLSTRIEPGEYLCILSIDYKTAKVDPIKGGYNVSIACSVKYQVKLAEPDKDLSVIKSIMLPKIESLQRYKKKMKESFVNFTGNRFESSSYGFLYLKNNMKEEKYVKLNLLKKNLESIEGDLPEYLRFEPGSKYLFLMNRLKANEYFIVRIKV